MQIRILTTPADRAAYERRLAGHPEASLWQSLEREPYLRAIGKETRIYAAFEGENLRASAMVVIDRTSGGWATWDVPRGPIGADSDQWAVDSLLHSIVFDARKARCLSLYLSPQHTLTTDHFPLTTSPRHIHAEATRIIGLTPHEDAILAQMKPKGRYNIRIAQKHGIRVEESDDVDAFHALLAKTAERDRFTGLSKEKYRAFLRHMSGAFLLLAYPPHPTSSPHPSPSPIAGLIGVIWRDQGIYYYGASEYAHRGLMAPYLLQWEAMRRCKAAGCRSYDLLGIAPEGAGDDHPWAGISRFKAQFGGSVVQYPPERQIVLRPVLHALLRLKRILL